MRTEKKLGRIGYAALGSVNPVTSRPSFSITKFQLRCFKKEIRPQQEIRLEKLIIW
jgi:hypothetical protein